MSHLCPGLCGPGARTDIRPRDIGDVLSGDRPVIIPLFQRKYCWEPLQAHRWFRDTLRAARNAGVGGKHGVGKVTFKDRGGARWCLDGQQRLTTASLQLAAARDAALRLRRSLPAGTAEEVRARLDRTVAKVSQHLFMDAAAAESWLEGTAVAELKRAASSGGEAVCTAWHAWLDNRAESYEKPPHVRLVPSLDDRRPFSELILAGLVVERMHPAVENLPVSAVAAASHMGGMKAVFDEKIASLVDLALHGLAEDGSTDEELASGFSALLSWVTSAVGTTPAEAGAAAFAEPSLARAAVVLEGFVERAMQWMYLLYVDVLSDVNLAQVFLWMQEKTLFGMGALLYNPSPGKDFHAADLARNLFLAPFMDEEHEQQEERYRELWLRPFEARLPAPQLRSMDAVIEQFLESAFGDESDRHVSAFERQVLQMTEAMAKAGVTKHDNRGIGVYARLFSAYEQRCATWREENDDPTPVSDPSIEAEAEGAVSILADLSRLAGAFAASAN